MTRKRARKLCMSLKNWDRNEAELYLDHVPLSNGITTYSDMVEFALDLERHRIKRELERAYMKSAGKSLVLGFEAGIADGISKEKVL